MIDFNKTSDSEHTISKNEFFFCKGSDFLSELGKIAQASSLSSI